MQTKKKFVYVELAVVGIFLLVYAVAAISVSLNRYWQYDAFWYDFGIFDETVWKLAHFHSPVIVSLSAPLGKIVWADHFNPSIALLAPVYWLTDRAEIILIAQVVSVVASAGVAYSITRKKIKHVLVRVALVVSYLGFVGLQNALYTDVHNVVFALLPLMLIIWAILNKKWRWYWVFLILTLGIQENMAAVGVGLGLFLLLQREKQMRIGLITVLVSILWGGLAYYVVIPYFNHGPYKYTPDLPVVWYEWFTRFFSSDLKTPTIVLTFLTFGIFPLWSVASYPLIIEHFLERFVLNSAATRWDLGFHYNALLSPIMFLASVDVVTLIQTHIRLKKLLPAWGLVTIGMVFFLHRFYLHGPLMLATHPVFYTQTKRNAFIGKFVEQIPTKGLLMTQNNLATHFTHRNTFLLSLNFAQLAPDIVALDVRPGQNANDFFPLTPKEVEILVASLSASPVYKRQEVTDSQLIFTRK